jgi:hypothetical protein
LRTSNRLSKRQNETETPRRFIHDRGVVFIARDDPALAEKDASLNFGSLAAAFLVLKHPFEVGFRFRQQIRLDGHPIIAEAERVIGRVREEFLRRLSDTRRWAGKAFWLECGRFPKFRPRGGRGQERRL